jgi:hypothetical protein
MPVAEISTQTPFAPIFEEQARAILDGPKTLSPSFVTMVMGALRQGISIADSSVTSEMVMGFNSTKDIDPLDAVCTLARSSEAVATILAGDTGVIEGYRLYSHNQAVLGRFATITETDNPFDADELKVLRTALMLQDIGKPLSKAETGSKDNQTRYNNLVADNILSGIDRDVLSPQEARLTLKLLGHDALGGAFQELITVNDAKKIFDEIRFENPGIRESTLNSYFRYIYFSDATAYTKQAEYRGVNGEWYICSPTHNYIFDMVDPAEPSFISEQRKRIMSTLAGSEGLK